MSTLVNLVNPALPVATFSCWENTLKMMSELRFQCYEVEKMQSAHRGLIESNTLLLAQAASARHSVGEMARRSHLLQRIIRYMHQKVEFNVLKPNRNCDHWRVDSEQKYLALVLRSATVIDVCTILLKCQID